MYTVTRDGNNEFREQLLHLMSRAFSQTSCVHLNSIEMSKHIFVNRFTFLFLKCINWEHISHALVFCPQLLPAKTPT